MNIINGVETAYPLFFLSIMCFVGRLGVGLGGDETEGSGGRKVKQFNISVGGVYGIGLGHQIILL
jgi:hypothetical protein